MPEPVVPSRVRFLTVTVGRPIDDVSTRAFDRLGEAKDDVAYWETYVPESPREIWQEHATYTRVEAAAMQPAGRTR